MDNRKRNATKYVIMHDVMHVCKVRMQFTSLGTEPVWWTTSFEYGRTIRVNGAKERYILMERSYLGGDLRVYISEWERWEDMIYWLQQKLQQICNDYVRVEISTDQNLWFGLFSIWPYVKNHLTPLPDERK